ncbi:MAG: phosphotransferase [Actinobacteria bacterium]|nr:phosphotransferase [Actinomycetota bacterium]
MTERPSVFPADLPILNDPVLPTVDLLGDELIDLLNAAYAAGGATVERVRPAQSTYHPQRSLTVLHEVTLRRSDSTLATERVGISVGRTAPERATVLSDGLHDIVIWEVPNDPWLAGLAPAMRNEVVAGLLASVDLPAETVNTRLRAYRPGRRAVIEAHGPQMRAFLKVVRPASAEALHRRHEYLAEHLAVPHSFGWSAEHGIVVLQALPGRTLRQAMLAGLPLPGAAALTAVLDSLPDPTDDLGVDAGPSVNWRGHEFAALLGAVAPDLAERTAAIAAGLEPFEARAAQEPIVAVHGDFYEAQLLVDRTHITGVIDVDTYGWGRRVEDYATMIGHLAVLAIGSPKRAVIERYAARLLDGFDRSVDPALQRAAVAGVILGLATGSFRVLEANWHHHTLRRVALAEAWLDSAIAVQRPAAMAAVVG